MIYIYKITNRVNSKVYVGMTSTSLHKRLLGHIRNSKKPKFRLHQAISKHGKDNFYIEELDVAENQNDANILERYWIDELKSTNYDIGYNMANGGSGKSIILSEEIKLKISQSVQAHRNGLTDDEKKNLTRSANMSKTGMQESEESRKLKSEVQTKRWELSTEEERKQHGIVSRNGISEEGKRRSIVALNSAYSPAREPGLKKKQITCPCCGLVGGVPVMKRFHFENCKENKN